jgi:hypothetical protein
MTISQTMQAIEGLQENKNIELEALQNAANRVDLVVHLKQTQDKRKRVNRYFLTKNGTSISPVLDYEHLNCFLLGFIKAKSVELFS